MEKLIRTGYEVREKEQTKPRNPQEQQQKKIQILQHSMTLLYDHILCGNFIEYKTFYFFDFKEV